VSSLSTTPKSSTSAASPDPSSCADHGTVAGLLTEPADLGDTAGGFLAPLVRFRIQLQHQPMCRRPQLSVGQRSGGLGQIGVGFGRVLGGQDAGLLLDDPQPRHVQLPGA